MSATSRAIQDASLKVSHVLPNAGNTVNTASINLGAPVPFPVQSQFDVKLSLSAATGANTKNINTTIQDSADNSSFTDIAELAKWVVISAGTAYAATTRTVRLPSSTRQYIRAQSIGEANGGDASDGTITLQPLF